MHAKVCYIPIFYYRYILHFNLLISAKSYTLEVLLTSMSAHTAMVAVKVVSVYFLILPSYY